MRQDRSLAPGAVQRAGAVLLAATLMAAASAADAGAEARDLAERMNRLGSDAVGRLVSASADETVVVSPYSLGSSLHLLSLGAAGPAQKSLLAKLLPSGMDTGKQIESLIALKRNVSGSGGTNLKLTVANAVFVPRAAMPASAFITRAHDVFDAPVEAVDFRSASTLEQINAWAKEATRGLIPSVLGQLDPDARFVLANAVYFNGAWETAFDPKDTAKAPFTHADGSTRDVDMMNAVLRVAYAEVDNLQGVWLPYVGKDIAMLVVAPGQKQSPTAIAEALKRKSIAELMAQLQPRRVTTVQVRLPRLRAESDLDMTDLLTRLSLAPALSARSDYDAISIIRGGPLRVTHRAVLEVTEAGTKAAAASTVTSDRSLTIPPVFSADRPFAFAIVHAPTQAILFAGYIADPGEVPAPATAESKTVR